jgi:hypothetical protein
MLHKFSKNIGIYIFSMLSVLVYFKLLTSYVNVDTLGKYFEIKAFGMILYYSLSIRYSEFSYILKAHKNYSLFRMECIFGLYSGIVLTVATVLIWLLYTLDTTSFHLYIISYLIFLLNDVVDSYVSINRLFHKYLVIFNIKFILIFKSILFYILFMLLYVSIDIHTIFLYEVLFNLMFAAVIVFYVLYHKKLSSLFHYIVVYKNNLPNIKNTWLGSVSKIPYEAFPTYFLSFFVGTTVFVEYNIARKVYAMTTYANQPFLQILNTFSIDLKHDFSKYLKLYYIIIIPLNVAIGSIIYFQGKFLISFLSNEIYATDHTLNLVYIMFTIYCFYNMIYPFRQYVVLNKLLKLNNTATILSIGLLLLLTLLTIPLYTTYALSFIQPLGLILPIVLTFILLLIRNQHESSNNTK